MLRLLACAAVAGFAGLGNEPCGYGVSTLVAELPPTSQYSVLNVLFENCLTRINFSLLGVVI